MATTKVNKYIEQDLLWLEGKLEELKSYIDARPFTSLDDRMGFRETKAGGVMPFVISTIEAQRKDLTSALQECAQLLDAIQKLKEKEDQKKLLVRGTDELTPMESGEI